MTNPAHFRIYNNIIIHALSQMPHLPEEKKSNDRVITHVYAHSLSLSPNLGKKWWQKYAEPTCNISEEKKTYLRISKKRMPEIIRNKKLIWIT